MLICATYASNEILSNVIDYIKNNISKKNFCLVTYINSEINKLCLPTGKSDTEKVKRNVLKKNAKKKFIDELDSYGNVKDLIDYEYSSADDEEYVDDEYDEEEYDEENMMRRNMMRNMMRRNMMRRNMMKKL